MATLLLLAAAAGVATQRRRKKAAVATPHDVAPHEPANAAQLRIALHVAAARQHVVVEAAGLSCHGPAPPHAAVIDMTHLNAVLEWDAASLVVTVEAGITLDALLRWLAARGATLRCIPFGTQATLGGALATGTHGFGDDGFVCDAVQALYWLSDADEPLRRIDRHGDARLFAAAVCAVGTAGICYAVELRCAPQHMMRIGSTLLTHRGARDVPLPLDDQMVAWNPYNGDALVMSTAPVVDDARPPAMRAFQLPAAPASSSMLPHALSGVAWSIAMRWFHANIAMRAGDAYPASDALALQPRERTGCRALEVALPRCYDQGGDGGDASACRRALAMLEALLMERRSDAHVLYVTMRRTPPAQAPAPLLLPVASGAAYWIQLGAADDARSEALVRDARNLLVREANAMPHWGKRDAFAMDEFRARFSAHARQFAEQRRRLDPSGRFAAPQR